MPELRQFYPGAQRHLPEVRHLRLDHGLLVAPRAPPPATGLLTFLLPSLRPGHHSPGPLFWRELVKKPASSAHLPRVRLTPRGPKTRRIPRLSGSFGFHGRSGSFVSSAYGVRSAMMRLGFVRAHRFEGLLRVSGSFGKLCELGFVWTGCGTASNDPVPIGLGRAHDTALR